MIDRGNDGTIDQQIDLTDENEPEISVPKLHAMVEEAGRVRTSWTDANSNLVLESTAALGNRLASRAGGADRHGGREQEFHRHLFDGRQVLQAPEELAA